MPSKVNKINTFGEELRKLRVGSHLSLRQVADRIGIDASLLGKIERNERRITKEQLKRLATFFLIDEKQLVQENLSDMIAHKIIEEGADINTLDIARRKVEHLKSSRISRQP